MRNGIIIFVIVIFFAVAVPAQCRLDVDPALNIEKGEFDRLTTRLKQLKKAYRVASLNEIESAQGYAFSPSQRRRFLLLKQERFTGIYKLCLIKLSPGTDGYYGVIIGEIRYKGSSDPRDIYFYIRKKADGKFTFTEILFPDIDRFELQGLPNEIIIDQ